MSLHMLQGFDTLSSAGESDYYSGGYTGMGHSAFGRVLLPISPCPVAQTVSSSSRGVT